MVEISIVEVVVARTDAVILSVVVSNRLLSVDEVDGPRHIAVPTQHCETCPSQGLAATPPDAVFDDAATGAFTSERLVVVRKVPFVFKDVVARSSTPAKA